MPQLAILEDERVFRAEIVDDGYNLQLTEMCDEFFEVKLCKFQLAELIDELQAIHDKMKA